MKTSELWSVDIQDFLKGLVLAVFSALIAFVGESVSKGVFTFDWVAIWHVGFAALMAYLMHAFISSPKVPAQTQ